MWSNEWWERLGGFGILEGEVKFLDLWKTTCCESVDQRRLRQSRTKVGGSKTIRYRRSPNHKLCQLRIGGRFLMTPLHSVGNQSSRVPGGVWSQGWNLKKLTGIHLQARSVWLNLTQHGETYQVQTRLGLTDWQLFLDCVNSGAWPVLVGEVICLVNSVNERDLRLLNSCPLNFFV